MPTIAELRKSAPELAGMDDARVVRYLHNTHYSNLSQEDIASQLGIKLPEAVVPEAPRSWGSVAQDVGISALKGAIGVPEAAVGLADMATGGYAGQLAEQAGFRPKEAKAMLDTGYSSQQQAAFQKVQAAQGLGDTFMAAVQNPSVVAHSVVESLPLMGAGGVLARGGLALAPKLGAVAAGAVGEGAVGAGSAAEQIRQQGTDGLLTGQQTALAGATGVLTTGFSMLGGKIAQKLGIADVDTMLAGAATNPAVAKGVVRSALEGALSEGVLEELPQSVAEQVLQNQALGKPLDEGVNQAAVLGLLSGGTMGAGANMLSSFGSKPEQASGLPQPTPDAATPASPALQLGNTPDPLIGFPDGTVARRSEADAYINSLPPEQQPAARAKIMGLAPQPAKPAGALTRAANAASVGLPGVSAVQEIQLNQASEADQAAYEQATSAQDQQATQQAEQQAAEQDTTNQPITHGKIAEAALSPEDKQAVMFSNKAVADGGHQWTGTQDGDILNGMGAPFKTKFAAVRRSQMEGKDWTIAPVFDGFVARRGDANGATDTTASLDQPAAAGPSNQPAGSAQPAMGAVPAASGNAGDTGAVAGLTEPGNTVVDGGGSADAVAPSGNSSTPVEKVEKVEPAKPSQEATKTVAKNTWEMTQQEYVNHMEENRHVPLKARVGDATPAWRSMHKDRIEEAIASGKPVPAEVLADYPDLQPNSTPAASTQSAPQPAPAKLKTASKADLDHLFGVDQKRKAAIGRIAKGTAYFSQSAKAQEFIAKNGLKDTHQAVKNGARWEIQTKDSQPQGNTHGTQAAQTVEAAQEGSQAPAAAKPVATTNSDLADAELPANLRPSKDGRNVFAAGQAARNEGKPRATPSYITNDSKAKDWAKGWDYADQNQAKPVTPQLPPAAPVKEYGAGFEPVGARAFSEGKPRVLPTELRGLKSGTIAQEWYRGWDDANVAAPVRNMQTANAKPEIVTDKAEMRPYRKPDGSVGYEAVPIQAEKPDGYNGHPAYLQNTSGPLEQQKPPKVADKPASVEPAAAKPDALSEQEKAAKDKMLGAAAKLAALLSKNTRLNITPEQEQAMLPIVIELFEGAMDLGYVKFKQAARYVREFLANAIDQDAADSIPIDTLQGAYIATARRHADKDITPKKDVIAVDALADLQEDVVNAAENADTVAKDIPNAAPKLDSASTGPLDRTPAETVSGPEKVGPTDAGADASSGADGAGHEAADGSGGDSGRGVSGGAGAVPVSTGGKGKQPRSAKKPRVQGDAGLQPGFEFIDTAGGTGGLIPVNPAPNAAPIAAPAFTPTDFTIEDDFALGEGGAKAKFKGNIEAVKLLAQLDQEHRAATPTEQAVLARYVGWGGLAQAFDDSNKDWSKEYSELKGLMSADDYADARVSTRYAHFTSRQVIQDGIYAALRHMGFNGGRALEGGAGVGNFMGLMPTDMRSASRFTAIEREPFSAKIAKHLYPQQNVQEADFTEFVGNDDFYDVAVGNPPFASDPQVDRSGRKHLSGLSLHNYFFAKEVDMLREGGILAQVVTSSFLDATTDTARTYIADKTKFLGAIRLPNNAFSKNANTEVTTDLIFLQKRPESEWGGKAAKLDAKRWLGVGEFKDQEGRTVPLNQYFIDQPGMMLGKFGAYGTMYRGESPALVQKPGQDTSALLKEAVAKLPAGAYVDRAITATANMQDALVKTLSSPSVHEGGYFEEDGKLFQRIKDIAGEARGKEITPLSQWTEKTKLGDAGFARIKSLSSMRATVRSLLAAELSNDAKMVDLRKLLNEQYDAYAKEHGLINDPGTLRVFDDDPDFPLLASLEHGYTPAIGLAAAKSMGIKMVKSSAKKGPIFTQRVIDARQQVAKVETPADALAVSMAERGKLDSAYIGELLGRDPEEVLQDLSGGDSPLLFKDPATGEYALRDAYLSGNVRAKLIQAKQAGMFNNIKALEEVQPEDVGSHEIVARVGSPWVPESVYQDFAKMLFGDGTNASIKYVKTTAGYSAYITAGSTTANTNTWGTAHYPGTDILSALLNNKPVRVTYKDGDGKTHVDVTATENANAKAQDMRNKFQDWLFSDGDRAELLGRAYNDTNNNYVTREFDGEWMTFPGKVPNAIVKFRRHQRNAIARIVQDRTALLDHVVGSGKTYTIIAAAMELRRTGLARKPMIAVPNHLVKQWASDFYKLYPGANILTATKKDFEKTNRRKFLAKIATGDWDAVIIAHSSFGFIKPAPDFEHQFNNKQIANIVKTINEVENGDGDKQQKKRTVKQLEGIKERLENRIKSLRDKPMDALLDFGELGVDQLFVDEAHMFKNLMFSTKMQNIAGLGDSKGSQRAYDMYVKANQLFSQNGRGQGLVFATGTPVSNSLAEMYHMMRYLMPAQMEEMGFESFDAWANTYASVEQVWMQKASGDGFKAQNRMSNFVNTPELLKVFDQVSDTVTIDDIKKAYAEENSGAEFPLPKLKGGKRSPVSLRKSAGQEAYMATVAARALALEQRKGPPQKGEDNILVIMSDARKAAMDIRLVDPAVTEREAGGRIDRASQEIFARYKQFDSVKGTQLVFSDLGTPLKTAKKELVEFEALNERIAAGSGDEVMQRAALGDESAQDKVDDAEDAQEELDAKGRDWLGAMQAAERGFSVYDDLKAALIEKGIPEQEIAFIHDYNTDEQKAGLFRKMNAGQIRVLVGSTPKLGAGTNVQERLVALHHLDVPWKPSDVEQREGRIIRQGNKLMDMPDFEVEVLAYVTQDTLDMRMWQVQETKLKMINQLRTRKIGREVENAFEDLELSAGEMQAAATGNIDLLREIQIKGEIKKLEQRKRAFDAQKSDLQNRKKSVNQKLDSLPAKIGNSKVMADATDQYKAELAAQADQFKATIDGKEFTSAKEASDVLLGMIDAHVYMQRQEDGKYGGKQLTQEQADKEPAQDPKAADYNPWVKRPVPLAVNFNGEDFKSRDKLAEAFSNARGDRDPIAWRLDGTTLNRRTLIESGIRQAVADAIAEEQVKDIGTLGPFAVSVEGQSSSHEKFIDVTLSYGGQTISNARGLGGVNEGTTERTVPVIVRMAENMAISARQQHDYEKRQLEQAKKEKAELDATETAGDWPEQDKLEELRKKHKEVLQRLSGVGIKATLDGETIWGGMGGADAGVVDDSDVVFSRATTQSAGMAPAQVQSIVDRVASRWANAPEIIVATSMSDKAIPQAVQDYDQKQRSLGATGNPEGFVYGGKVYLLADQLSSPGDVVQVLLHESLGHMGMRGVFGDSLKPILKQIAAMRAGDVRAKAKQYGIDMNTEAGRLEAAEEVLAELAQSRPDLGYVKRAIAAIRNWLRSHGFAKMAMTDADIIQGIILPARRHIEGKTSPVSSVESAGPEGQLAFSRAAVVGYTKIATDKLNETFSHPGKLNWWHKSFGTMNNLAERSPEFKPVFQAAQGFIDDTSYYATEAADMAPSILPKLENWADLAKSPITPADNKAVSAPIFEGTLSWARDESGKPVRLDDLEATYAKLDDEAKAQMLLKKRIVTENELKRWKASPLDIYTGAVRNRFETAFLTAGVVWTDAELKSQFSLTSEQIKLYREFRSTVDKSLDNLAKADLLRFGGKDAAMLQDQVMDAKDADEAAVLLRDYLHSQRDLMPERADDLTAAAGGMIDRADKVNKLKAQGYAPLSRFGKYTVDVVVNGERQYFSLFETERESNKMAAKMRMEYGTAAVGQGTLSESEFKLFAGITPESLELFGNMLGLDATGDAESDKAFQTYLKLTKTNRSAMRRMIHRKGIAGFSEDAGRVLASFVYSNARQTSAALHMGTLGEAVNNIPKSQGELKDAAIALADYIKNPQEEAQAVRGLLFAQYLGGSISSAFVNMTQPFAVTFPWLSQFGGAKQSGAQLLRAMKDMAAKDTVWSPDLAKALKHAEENGIVSPQEVHQLMAQARGAGTLKSGDGTRTGDALATASNAISKLSLGWGKVFGMAEQLNRRSTFIAAYRVAQAQAMKDPADFAERAVNETQFVYSKANKMKFGRGAIGGTLMTFKSYSISYLELLSRMATQGGPEGKKAVVLALAVMMLMGGAGGLPFMEDATDLIDGLLQRLGYNVSTKKAKQQFLEDLFGKTMADFVDRGVSGLPGMPLDVTGRLGMGNVIPGTGLFQSKMSHASDLGELVGPAGDMAKRAFDASGKLMGGDIGGAALAMSPVAVRNAAKGADMASTGMYRDAKGYKVLDTTMLEAALKSIGFQPESVANVQEANYINQKAKNFYTQTASEIRAQWAKGIFEKDQDQIDSVRSRMLKWNEKNPDQRISANMGSILKRVHEMRKTKDQRIADTAPRAMRAAMRRDLAEEQ